MPHAAGSRGVKNPNETTTRGAVPRPRAARVQPPAAAVAVAVAGGLTADA